MTAGHRLLPCRLVALRRLAKARPGIVPALALLTDRPVAKLRALLSGRMTGRGSFLANFAPKNARARPR